ncbi:MAG: hypothetical protein VYC51_16965, partial [Pseudomonadota bacterium]|nr:hypothetical protein [Pseudomonadota bacterium]
MSYKTFHCIFTEPKHSRFSVLLNENNGLQFVYWLELKKLGIRHLSHGEELCAQASLKPQDTIERGLLMSAAVCFEAPAAAPDMLLFENESFDQQRLADALQQKAALIVFRQCRFDLVNLE